MPFSKINDFDVVKSISYQQKNHPVASGFLYILYFFLQNADNRDFVENAALHIDGFGRFGIRVSILDVKPERS